MRLQVLIIIGLLLALIVTLLGWSRWHSPAGKIATQPSLSQDSDTLASTQSNHLTALTNTASTSNAATGDDGTNQPSNLSADTIAAQETEIEHWLQDRGPDALPGLLHALDSDSKEVRGNALEALKQLGNRQAIPALEQKAERVQDADEKASLLSAADYLATPNYGEK